jgi:hypothetical protein
MEEIISREELFLQGLKVCSCCGGALPLSDFGKRSNSVDGLIGYCKVCAKQKRDKYYESESNKQKARDRTQRHRDKNREDINAKRRQQYRDDEEVRRKNSESCKKYVDSHKEEVAQYKREYRLSRLDFFLNYNREYYKTHQDYFYEWRQSEAGRLSNIKSHEKRRCLLENAEGDFTTEDVLNALSFFDNRCAYTGRPLVLSYHLDHVVALSKGGTNYIWNIVPSNPFPNLSKGANDMETWYRRQPYFSEERLLRIYDWINLQKGTEGEKKHDTRNIEEVAV